MLLVDYSNFFDVILKIFDALASWGSQLWELLTYDLHNLIAIIPEGTTLITLLPIIGATAVIIAIIIKLIV